MLLNTILLLNITCVVNSVPAHLSTVISSYKKTVQVRHTMWRFTRAILYNVQPFPKRHITFIYSKFWEWRVMCSVATPNYIGYIPSAKYFIHCSPEKVQFPHDIVTPGIRAKTFVITSHRSASVSLFSI